MKIADCRLVSFDCYGTLMDWETGLLSALRAALPELGLSDDEILATFAEIEPQIQAGEYKTYRVILREVLLCLFHDIAPAGELGIKTVWVNRPSGRTARASKRAVARPDLTVCDLNELADKMC